MVAKCDEETVLFAVITTEIITLGTIATWDKINIVSKTNDLIKIPFGHKLMDSKH